MNDAARLESRVEREAVDALYRQGRAISVSSAVVAALVLGIVHYRTPEIRLGLWFAVFIAIQAARLALCAAYWRRPTEARDHDAWARRFQWSMMAGGATWGSLAVLAFPAGDPFGQMLLLNIVAGLAAAAVASTAYHPPTFRNYLVLLLGPFILRLAMEWTLEYAFIAFTAAMYLLLMVKFGNGLAMLLRESMRASHRNAELAASLARRSAEAEAASRAKSQFFAAASHDLRQPLHALGLFAASLRDSVRSPEDARRVDHVLASVDALDELFEELLDISRLDTGQIAPAPVHVPVRKLFDRLARVYAPVAAHAGIALKLRRSEAVLHTDPVLLERVLGNLIANAIRYTPRGGVLVACRRRAPGWSIEVRDTGVGIAEGERERIFEEFVQLANPERDRKKGLGLGLATVRRIATLLGLEVAVVSVPGRGSVFRVQVPAGDADRVAAEAAAEAGMETDVLTDRVVLVIDDERAVREGMRDLLARWKCRVVDAGSAQEALERLAAEGLQPAVAVVDYRLRASETGFAAVEALRARFGGTLPAILVSGDPGRELVERARAARLLLLAKPVRAARLRAALAHYLRREGGTQAGSSG